MAIFSGSAILTLPLCFYWLFIKSRFIFTDNTDIMQEPFYEKAKGEKMYKKIWVFCCVLILTLGACNPSKETSEQQNNGSSYSQSQEISLDSSEPEYSDDGSEEENSSKENSSCETLDSEDSIPVEGGDNSLVVGTYFFESGEEYATFYEEFIKLNEERYYSPIVTVGEMFDSVEYSFEVYPILLEISINNRYVGVDFPSNQELTFYFSKSDDSVLWESKWTIIEGTVYNVSEADLSGGEVTLVQTDELGKEYNVCVGETVVCSFSIGLKGYDNKEEYLQLIKDSFIIG